MAFDDERQIIQGSCIKTCIKLRTNKIMAHLNRACVKSYGRKINKTTCYDDNRLGTNRETTTDSNCYAVKASCYGCRRSIVTPKEHNDNRMKEYHKEKYYVSLTRDKPIFTCVDVRGTITTVAHSLRVFVFLL